MGVLSSGLAGGGLTGSGFCGAVTVTMTLIEAVSLFTVSVALTGMLLTPGVTSLSVLTVKTAALSPDFVISTLRLAEVKLTSQEISPLINPLAVITVLSLEPG